jgi:hypothetical protein
MGAASSFIASIRSVSPLSSPALRAGMGRVATLCTVVLRVDRGKHSELRAGQRTEMRRMRGIPDGRAARPGQQRTLPQRVTYPFVAPALVFFDASSPH